MTPPRERWFSVWLNARKTGVLSARDDYTWFAFDREYLEDPHRAVLGLRFEEDLRARHSAHMRLPAWFSNLLPEGRLREWIATARGVPVAREMELLAQVGHDLPGAVRVLPAEDPAPPEVDAREVPALSALQSLAPAAWRFSLAGVQLKFSMLGRGDRFTAPATGDGGDWVVKLPDPAFADVPVNEFAMMELARLSGISVPETKLVSRDAIQGLPDSVWRNNETLAFAVRRFDRLPGGLRIHMEDLAQVRGFYPGDEKYAGSFETVGALIYRGRDVASVREFVRRLAFNVIIRNGDAHLKNWSLIYDDPRVPRLSPAYDLVATSVYRPPNEPEDLGLKLDGSRRFERVTLATFGRLQKRLGVEGVSFEEDADDVITRAIAAWPQVQDLLGRSRLAAAIDDVVTRSAAMIRARPRIGS